MRQFWNAARAGLGLASIAALFVAAALAQTSSPPPKDPLGRDDPQDAIFQFLEACHARNYGKAARYLDLRKMTPAERAAQGPELARQLEDLLDDTSFDITILSRDPAGDLGDGLSPAKEHLATFTVNGQKMELELERIETRPGTRVWEVSPDSLPLIPKAHQLLRETPLESKLPQVLVNFELFDTPIWRWIALLIAGVILWFVAGGVARLLTKAVHPVKAFRAFRGPVRLVLAVGSFRAAMGLAPPSTLPRLAVERGLGMLLALGLAWAASVVIDRLATRWHTRLDPRAQAVTYSMLPLGRQVVKLLLFLLAVLSVASAWGYNTSGILAGLGVGGLAFALAAQKTIENLFGGISVIGDRPVLVGDFCRFGDRQGTVSHIGLRSTRIRTLDRTIISIPNGQFSAMELENFSVRDKIWFHPALSLRRDTTAEQMLRVLGSVERILKEHPKVETGALPVRFVGVAAGALNVEVFAYVKTGDGDEFLAIQQELLLKILQAVEQAGTALALPVQENVSPPQSSSASA
ncbi:MAG TPA: mechanosensitive ion channel family protein [Bryobacteraceae bacterium]|nr:mechanosensitive ion channel family protein [Bryobacteraceae bacterium]